MNPTPSPERPEPQYAGYRTLDLSDHVESGDQHDYGGIWNEVSPSMIGLPVEGLDIGHLRRRVATRTAPEAVAGERKDYPKYCATCRNYLSGFCQLKGEESPKGSTSAHWPKCSRLDWCGKHEVEIEMHYFLNNRRMDYNASKEPLTVSQARAALPLDLCQRKIFWEHDLSEPLGELILIPKNASVVALPEAYPS